VPELIAALASRKWLVFKRVALHVLALAPEAAPTLADKFALETHLFDNSETRAEYRRLL
jgi:hypothetical protein